MRRQVVEDLDRVKLFLLASCPLVTIIGRSGEYRQVPFSRPFVRGEIRGTVALMSMSVRLLPWTETSGLPANQFRNIGLEALYQSEDTCLAFEGYSDPSAPSVSCFNF